MLSVNREDKVKKMGVVSLLKEFWVFSFPSLKAFGWMVPFLIIWRSYFPEIYYGSRFTVFAEFGLFVIAPLLIPTLIYEFWKSKKE